MEGFLGYTLSQVMVEMAFGAMQRVNTFPWFLVVGRMLESRVSLVTDENSWDIQECTVSGPTQVPCTAGMRVPSCWVPGPSSQSSSCDGDIVASWSQERPAARRPQTPLHWSEADAKEALISEPGLRTDGGSAATASPGET